MTEPTRDEINRALAEWEGWTDIRTSDDGLSGAVGKRDGRWKPMPSYVDSLDAQMPLWERIGAVDIRFQYKYPRGWMGILGYTSVEKGIAATIPEASARALYAVLETSR